MNILKKKFYNILIKAKELFLNLKRKIKKFFTRFFSKEYFKKVREFFWPLLEGESTKTNNIILSEIKIEKENLKIAFDLAIKYFNYEEDRNKNIESKSIVFISILGITITLLTAFTNAKLFDFKIVFIRIISIITIILLVLILLYSIRSIYFSCKVLKRKNFKLVGFNDFNINGKEEKYLKKLIVMLINYTNNNSLIINEKVDFMTMSQEYFTRAVVVIFLYSIIMLIKSLF